MKSLSDGADSSFGLAGIKTVDELYEHYRTVPAQYYGNDGNGCHTYCRLVTHAAYLMHQDGASKIGRSTSQALTWHELGRVWYKSLNLGLDSTSNFHTVRRNVIRAARQMRLAETKIITIRKAFDSLGITEAQGTLKGGIEDWDDGTVVPGSVMVSLVGSSGLLEFSAMMDSKGNFTVSADPGNYTVTVNPYSGNYRPNRTRVYVPAEKEARLDVELVKTGTGTLDVYLTDTGGKYVSGASVSVKNDYSDISRPPSSASSGKYTFSGLGSGYYTVYAYKTGFDSHSFKVTVPPGTGTTRNIFRTLHSTASTKYALYLVSTKSFLDPHMLIKYSGSSQQEISPSSTQTYAPNGRESGLYSSSDSGRTRFISFTHFASTEYRFYVHWNPSGGDDAGWNGAKPKVWLYYKGSLLRKYSPPDDDSAGAYWDVFRINRKGSRYTTN